MSHATELFAQVREALLAAQEVSRVESTGALPDFMPLAVALRNRPFAALDQIEQQVARTEQALDGWERDGHVFVRIDDVRAALDEPEVKP